MAPYIRLASLFYGTSLLYAALASPAGSQVETLELERRVTSQCTEMAGVPKGAKCGIEGTLSSPQLANDPAFAKTIQDCINLCQRHHSPRGKPIPVDPTSAGCLSFGYNSETSTCSMYSTYLRKMGFTADTSSGTYLYDLRCYSCPAQCPQKYGRNLFDNGNFEASSTLIGPWESGEASLVPRGKDGGNALVCSHVQDCNFFQTAQVCPDSIYHLSLSYKMLSNKPQTNTFSVVTFDAEFLDFFEAAKNNTWQPLDLWFRADSRSLSGAYLDFYPNSGKSVSDIYIDDVSLVRELDNYKPSGAEQVANGGFESGDLGPWDAHTFGHNSLSISSDPVIAGSYSLLFKGRVSDVDGTNYLRQTLSLTPGTEYLLQYHGQKVKGQAEYPSIFIGSILYDAPYPTTVGSKMYFAIPFVAYSEQVLLEFDFDYGPLLMDSISVKKL